MFEGLLSPTHLIIIAVVLFLVVGPRKMQARWHSMRDAGRRIIDDNGVQGSDTPAEPSKQTRGYRVGRLLRKR